MTVDRLKTRIWVQAQVRLCDIHNLPAYITQHGDPDAGAVILRLNKLDGTSLVYSQTRTLEGDAAWTPASGGAAGRLSNEAADAYITRQRKFDPDLWVLEIEDPNGRYQIDGKIV